jgi:hypothetical protein
MSAVDNVFQTYAAEANREDLSDIIYNIDPTDTPFVSSIGRRNVSNVTFDWQTENLPEVDGDNAQVEGFELSRSAATATVRLSNVCQISKRDATVSGSQNAANAAGKAKEMAHQMALVSKALKRDVEKVLVGAQGRNNGNSTTARKTRALESWLETNVLRASDGDNAANENSAPTDGTQRALTEALIKEAMQTAYIAGAEPSVLMVGPVNKLQVSTFEGRAATRVNVGTNTVTSNVTVYASDFGELKVVVNRWQRERTAFLLDPQFAAVGYYRNFQRTPIATIGDARTEMLVVEYGLEMRNEAAHAAVADIFDTNSDYEPVVDEGGGGGEGGGGEGGGGGGGEE